MAHKQTMAIIGATSAAGEAIAKQMSASYRMLLMDTSEASLAQLQSTIANSHKEAVAETVLCSKEASWEADVVVVTVEEEKLPAVAQKIKEVTTCKPVIHFILNDGSSEQLQQLLPHAKVVSVWLSQPLHEAANTDAVLHGTDSEAMDIAQDIVTKTGCRSSLMKHK